MIEYAKNILLKMIKHKNQIVLNKALDSISNIGGNRLDSLSEQTQLFYENIRKEALAECINIAKSNKEFNIYSKLENIAINTLNFHFSKEEALSLLKVIKRSDEYMLYQQIKGVDFIIYNFEEFKNNLPKEQDKIKEWIFKNIRSNNINISEKDKKIIQRLSKKYVNYLDFINLLNLLDMSGWNSRNILMEVLGYWETQNNILLMEVCKNHVDNIFNIEIKNTFKEFAFNNDMLDICIDNINIANTNDELRIYINYIFENFNIQKMDILNKIIEIISNKQKEDIEMFISIISQKLYFTIKQEPKLYKDLESIILQFLEWQLQYYLNIESYLTHHILYETIDNKNISIEIKQTLDKIVKNSNIVINEFDLKPVYKILDYKLQECINILYNKLTELDENKKPVYRFTHYFDNSNISEVILLKSFIETYDDFKILIQNIINFCKEPIVFIGSNDKEYQEYINLDYFFKYTVKQEYIKKLFDELVKNNDIEKISLLYVIVPVSNNYLDIIVKNLNLLEYIVSEGNLMNYLKQVGKIKLWTRTHMQNSDLVLSEEALFTEIYNKINSLSLQLKLKEMLEYFEMQKQQEIDEDIGRILGK
jgi:hypothetical protein